LRKLVKGRKLNLTLVVLIISLLLAACGGEDSTPTPYALPTVVFPTPTQAPPTSIPVQSLPALTFAGPTATPRSTNQPPPPTPTYRPSPTPELPALPKSPIFTPAKPDALIKAVTGWLNQQKDALPTAENGPENARARLRDLLATWNFIGAEVPVYTGDLDGDGKPEIVATVADDWTHFPSSIAGYGLVLVLKANKSAWTGSTLKQANLKLQKPSFRDEFVYPKLEKVDDLNADKKAEIVFSELYCGANTCSTSLHVLNWANNKFTDLTPDVPVMPSAKVSFEPGDTGTTILFAGGGFGSVGAGLQRGRTEYWRWDATSKTFKLADTKYEVSYYLYHRVIDGNLALDKANYPAAITLYTGALTDSTLKLWFNESQGTPQQTQDEKAILTAFARFRLALTYALSEDRANANQTLQDAIAKDGKFSGWATAFASAFQASKAPTATVAAKEGCVAAVKFSQQNPSLVDGLNLFGYANPTFKPEDICPTLK